MTLSEARNSFGKVVTFWHDDSEGYICGILTDLTPDDEEAVIKCGEQKFMVRLSQIHSGFVDEVDASSEDEADDPMPEAQLTGETTMSEYSDLDAEQQLYDDGGDEM